MELFNKIWKCWTFPLHSSRTCSSAVLSCCCSKQKKREKSNSELMLKLELFQLRRTGNQFLCKPNRVWWEDKIILKNLKASSKLRWQCLLLGWQNGPPGLILRSMCGTSSSLLFPVENVYRMKLLPEPRLYPTIIFRCMNEPFTQTLSGLLFLICVQSRSSRCR